MMGCTIHEKITPTPPNAGSGIQSCGRLLNCISFRVSLSKTNKRTLLYRGRVKYIDLILC